MILENEFTHADMETTFARLPGRAVFVRELFLWRFLRAEAIVG
jgi:hypothetical protein